MIAMALAAAAQLHWTGPHTVQYNGPGYFCGDGYRVQLARGERVEVLPQSPGIPSAKLILAHGEIDVWSGAQAEHGRTVLRHPGSTVTEQGDGASVSYFISNGSPYGIRLTSGAFHGFARDKWLFAHANFSSEDDHGDGCLASVSY